VIKMLENYFFYHFKTYEVVILIFTTWREVSVILGIIDKYMSHILLDFVGKYLFHIFIYLSMIYIYSVFIYVSANNCLLCVFLHIHQITNIYLMTYFMYHWQIIILCILFIIIKNYYIFFIFLFMCSCQTSILIMSITKNIICNYQW
jgi:hypothetical protein